MSFSLTLKHELINTVKTPLLKRNLAWGILIDADVDSAARTVSLTVSDEELAQAIRKILAGAFGKTPMTETIRQAGRVKYRLSLVSRQAADMVSSWDDIGLQEGEAFCPEVLGIDHEGEQCFLRGIFIGCGTINNPAKSCHLEFYLKHKSRAVRVCSLFATCLGTSPKMVARRTGCGLYFKNSNTIEEILAAWGATNAYFALVNSKIETDLRSTENRATNCVTRNISRSVEATQKQLSAIRYLHEHETLWAKLPPDLRETALLRLENESATLSELSLIHEPPISKSGLNHRLKRLMDIAKEAGQT